MQQAVGPTQDRRRITATICLQIPRFPSRRRFDGSSRRPITSVTQFRWCRQGMEAQDGKMRTSHRLFPFPIKMGRNDIRSSAYCFHGPIMVL